MKKAIVLFAAALISLVQLSGQGTSEYKARYERLVKIVGQGGVGVETLLDKWAEADSSDIDLLKARFFYWYEKAHYTTVETHASRRYLGQDPVLTLKDSLGADVNYFNVEKYDEETFGKGLVYLDKAIRLYPDRLDLRVVKASSLINLEAESPDMALGFLKGLIDENASGKRSWVFPGYEKIDKDFFDAMIQEYCVNFFSTIGTDASREAFKSLSEKMLSINKKSPDFTSNIGSYWMRKKDYKKALKYYDKAIKLAPGHYTSIKNAVTAAMQLKDIKLQKKYLPMMVKYGPESEKLTAQARLDALNR